MKNLKQACLAGFCALVAAGSVMAAGSQVLDLGARYHTTHSAFSALPFSDGDLTYDLGYEIHDENGFIQLICGYTPDFKDHKDIDFGITPEANLLFTDGVFEGGLGVLSTYTQGGVEGDNWMDLYWQWILGVTLPLGDRFTLQANACYVFKSWDRLKDFDVGDIDYAAYLGLKF